jgi:Phosphotransferase enzyme family
MSTSPAKPLKVSQEIAQTRSLPTPEEVEASTDILFDQGWGIRVVGVGDYVVKYGRNIYPEEAAALDFVAKHTTIPSPSLLGYYEHAGKSYLFMSRMPGVLLEESIKELAPDQLQTISGELKLMADQLRRLRISDFEVEWYIGSLNRQPCRDLIFSSNRKRSKGPFSSENEMYDNLITRWIDCVLDPPIPQSEIEFKRKLYGEISGSELVFTHGDLVPHNIMVQDGHVTGIIDWGQSGWYPAYWEYVKAMWGCADLWETVWPMEISRFLEPFNYALLVDNPMRRRLG